MGSLFQHMCKLIHGDRLKIDFVDEAVEDMNNKGQSRLYMPVACGEWIDGVIKRLEREDDDSNCNKAKPKETIQKYTDDGCKAQTIIKNPAAAAGRTAVKTPMQNITSTETHQKKDIYKLDNGNRTKIKEDCDFPAIQKLERGTYNENNGYKKKHKNHKTGLFPLFFKFMVCGSVILCGASASHTKQRVTKRLLTSYTCSLSNFYSVKSECHTDEHVYNMTINCRFRELCNSHENPVCLKTENMVVFVCLKRDISCEKGRMIKARQDVTNPNIVHLEEVNCSNGTYQPTDSDCINACSYNHMDIADMDERYVLSSKGDNISPTYVYCNYKKGYFNRDEKFNINYDQDVIDIPDICMHINDWNPCKKGKYPLPDGLCVSECEHGFDRNPPDFLCRPMESSVYLLLHLKEL